MLQKPQIFNDVLNSKEFEKLTALFYGRIDTFDFDPSQSRYYIGSRSEPRLNRYHQLLLPVAQKAFQSTTLLPTYSIFMHYEGEGAKLKKHTDINACTYTLDLCLYQKREWPIWIEGEPYTLFPNQALSMYGNDQIHWRDEIPEKESNHVAIVLFHFAEPDHWYFTKGPEYVVTIREMNK
jgi:hypothetical protein